MELNVEESDSVESVQRKIHESHGIPLEEQRLIFRELDLTIAPDATLSGSGVGDMSELIVERSTTVPNAASLPSPAAGAGAGVGDGAAESTGAAPNPVDEPGVPSSDPSADRTVDDRIVDDRIVLGRTVGSGGWRAPMAQRALGRKEISIWVMAINIPMSGYDYGIRGSFGDSGRWREKAAQLAVVQETRVVRKDGSSDHYALLHRTIDVPADLEDVEAKIVRKPTPSFLGGFFGDSPYEYELGGTSKSKHNRCVCQDGDPPH